MPPEFRIDSRREVDAIYVKVTGELDIATSGALIEAVRAAQESGAGFAVVDLEHVGFIDSEGLRALLIAKRMSDADGFRLALVRASQAVRGVVELTGAQQLLGLVDDAEAGTAWAQAGR
jgi:anti-anti-sigma factor